MNWPEAFAIVGSLACIFGFMGWILYLAATHDRRTKAEK